MTARPRSLGAWPDAAVHRIGSQPNPERIVERAATPTRRQGEIIALIAEGLTYSEVGLALGVGLETVKRHVQNALRRMNCRSGAQLVHYAWLKGYLPANEEWVRAALSRLARAMSENEQSA